MTARWNTDAPRGPYLRRAQAAGIRRTIVLPTFHSDYAVANAQLAKLVRQHAPRLIGFAAVNYARDAGRIREMIGEAVHRCGFRGVKVHGANALPTCELCEAVQAFGVPLLADVVGRAEIVDMLAPQYPRISIVIPHLGSFADDWRAQQQVVDQLVRYPNVFADTSGVRWFDYIVQAVRRAGPRKLLFGSDGPWLHPALELQKIRLLGLPPDDESATLGGKAISLLNGHIRRDKGGGLRPSGHLGNRVD